jgi:dynein heavy chain
MVKPKHLPNKDALVRLWCHEGARVFKDRLVNEEDREWFDDATIQQLHTALDLKLWEKGDFASSLYGDFLTKENKEYQELKDREKVNSLLVEYLEDYNINFPSRMELVFFQDAVNHVARIARVLSQPRGNALFFFLFFFRFYSEYEYTQ